MNRGQNQNSSLSCESRVNIENSKNQYNTDTLIQVDNFLRVLDLLPVNSSK